MTLGEALLRALPADDPLRAGGFDLALLDDPESSPRERFRRMVEVLAGRRTWTTRCTERLDAGDALGALALLGAAREAGAVVAPDAEGRARARWSELVAGIRRRLGELRATLEGIPREACSAAEFAEGVRGDLSALTFLLHAPTTREEVAEARAALARFGVLERDVNDIVAEATRELDAARRQHREAALGALRTLLDELDAQGADVQVQRALDALPELVRGRVTHMLESIEQGGLRDPLLQTMLAAYSVGGRLRGGPEGAGGGPVTTEVELSSASRARLGSAAGGGESLEGSDAMLAMLQRVRSLDDERRAHMWLASARATQSLTHRALALGYGLGAEGRHALVGRGASRLARLYLRDGLLCLTSARDAADLDIVESSVVALWVIATTPRLVARGLSIRDMLAAWSEQPERFFSFLGKEEAWEIFADLWSHEPSDVLADLHLEVALAHLTEPELLLRTCVLAVLGSMQLFRSSTVAVLRRLGRLLEAQGVPADVSDLLARVGEELVNDREAETASGRRAFVRRCLEDLHVLLEPLSGRMVVSPDELLALLRMRVDEVFAEYGGAEQPRVHVELLILAVYPQRRSTDLRLPFRVWNEKNAALARDLFLQVSIAREPESEGMVGFSDETSQQEISVGNLDAGEAREVSVWIDLDEALLTRTQQVKLTVLVRRAEEVLVRTDLPLALRPEPRSHPSSPYTAGASVVGDHFFGREKEVSSLLESLLGDNRRTPLVVGVRRIGKTSILQHIKDHSEVKRAYTPVYVSFEDRPDSDTTVRLLTYLCEQAWGCIPKDQRAAMNWSQRDFERDPYDAFETFFRRLDELPLRRRVLLVLDEFDRLIELAGRTGERQLREGVTLAPSEAVQQQVFGAIRKVVMTSRSVRMVFAGLPSIFSVRYQDRLFGLFEPVRVNAFKEEEALRVLDASKGVMRFDPVAREEVLWATGSQPYFLQLACHHLFARMLSEGRDLVSLRDVRDTIEQDILSNESYFLDYRSLVDEHNRPLLRAMAALLRELVGRRRFVSLEEIAAQLARDGVDAAGLDLKEAIEQLVADERPLLSASARGKRVYRITIGILGDYLLRGPRLYGR